MVVSLYPWMVVCVFSEGSHYQRLGWNANKNTLAKLGITIQL
jgi:hypothetical protein